MLKPGFELSIARGWSCSNRLSHDKQTGEIRVGLDDVVNDRAGAGIVFANRVALAMRLLSRIDEQMAADHLGRRAYGGIRAGARIRHDETRTGPRQPIVD